jgi:hypothetical protein
MSSRAAPVCLLHSNHAAKAIGTASPGRPVVQLLKDVSCHSTDAPAPTLRHNAPTPQSDSQYTGSTSASGSLDDSAEARATATKAKGVVTPRKGQVIPIPVKQVVSGQGMIAALLSDDSAWQLCWSSTHTTEAMMGYASGCDTPCLSQTTGAHR